MIMASCMRTPTVTACADFFATFAEGLLYHAMIGLRLRMLRARR